VVKSNLYTIRNRVTKEAMFDWAERESSVLEYLRRSMAHELAHGLLENVPIRRLPQHGMYADHYYTEYEMKAVILDEREYAELMRAKRDLTTLRGIINVK